MDRVYDCAALGYVSAPLQAGSPWIMLSKKHCFRHDHLMIMWSQFRCCPSPRSVRPPLCRFPYTRWRNVRAKIIWIRTCVAFGSPCTSYQWLVVQIQTQKKNIALVVDLIWETMTPITNWCYLLFWISVQRIPCTEVILLPIDLTDTTLNKICFS